MEKDKIRDIKIPLIFSEKCLEYGREHIENPARIKVAVEILKQRGYEFLTPQPISKEILLLVHRSDYLDKIRKGQIGDSDTIAYENIYEYAILAVGGAILAAKVKGFSLMRPPGHHVGRNGKALGVQTKGFCYLNNIAVAVKYLQKPALILDIDGHHGNGTEEIFYGDKNVIYISLHRSPFYPGTGISNRKNCFNYPLEADCGEEIYLKTLEQALKRIVLKKIKIIAVSAGFDSHQGDLASLGLLKKTFRKIGQLLAKLKKDTFFVLEGGYIGKNIGEDIDELLKGFSEK